jgi:hypothetical protein
MLSTLAKPVRPPHYTSAPQNATTHCIPSRLLNSNVRASSERLIAGAKLVKGFFLKVYHIRATARTAPNLYLSISVHEILGRSLEVVRRGTWREAPRSFRSRETRGLGMFPTPSAQNRNFPSCPPPPPPQAPATAHRSQTFPCST